MHKIAVEIVKKNIDELSRADSKNHCQEKYKELINYIQELFHYKIINCDEFKAFFNAANEALALWT